VGHLKRLIILGAIALIVGGITSVFASSDRFQPKDIQVQTTIKREMQCPLVVITEKDDSRYNGIFCTMSEVIPDVESPCLFHPEIGRNGSWELVSPSLCEGLLHTLVDDRGIPVS
jgi:hypothetical protein